jgi:MFS family permease
VFGVSEPDRPRLHTGVRVPIRLADVFGLHAAYWAIVAISAVLTLARFSEAFLVLRAQHAGLEAAYVPLVMVVMNVAYAASSYPMGVVSDRMERGRLLAGGCVVLIVSDLVLAHGTSVTHVMAGVVLWGLHMGMTQGLFAAMVTDVAPARLRGTAFGLFNLAGGLAMLVASVVAGALWQHYGPAATFGAGAAFTAIAMLGLITLWRTTRDARLTTGGPGA